MKRPIYAGIFLLAILMLATAGTKLSQMRRTTTLKSNDLFMVVRTTDGKRTNFTIETRYLGPELGPYITNSGSGGSGSLSSYVLTNGETKNVIFNGPLTMEAVTTNGQVVYLQDSIYQVSGNDAEFGNLKALDSLTIAGTSFQTYINNASNALITTLSGYDATTSNGLYSLIVASGISAPTATNISRYFATNSALITSNALYSFLAQKTNGTLYGTVTLNGGTANEILALDASKNITAVAGISATEAGALDGITGNIQDQINVLAAASTLVFSNVLTLNPTSSTPRLNGMHFTNQAARATAGYTIDVQPGVYHVPTNSFSMLRNGVNWNFRPGAVLISGTTGDESDYNIPFHDWSGAVTSYIWGAGTFIVSNNLANFLNLTNSASRVIFHGKEIRAANDQAAVMQGHPNDTVGGGSKLWLYLTDGLYSDGYDAYINQHNPNSAQTFIYASRLYGDNDDSGDSAFETTVGYANPGDCVIRVGAARGSVTLAKNIDMELGVLDLGAFNMIYSPTNDSGNGVLRNTYIYGTSNRTTSLIYSSDGRFGTAGTFVQCTLVGPTNRPIALITNDAVGKITFISSRFLDGFGATNSIRSVNAQRVTLVATDTPLGLHANVTASSVTNYPDARFKGLVTFDYGIDVNSDLNANGQLNAGDLTTTGTTILGGPLEVPTGAANGYVMTSDGSGVATWQAPTASGTNNPVLISGPTLALIANQTARGQFSTNASFAWAITGASNQSSVFEMELQNTATNTIFATNTPAVYSVTLGSNVTTFPIAPTSKLTLRGSLNRSNEWVVTDHQAPYAIGFANGTLETNHTTKTVTYTAPSGSGGGGAGSLPMNASQFNTNGSASIASGALTTNLSARGLTIPSITASRVAVINGSGNVTNSPAVDTTELEYLDGATANLQTQLTSITNGTARIADTNWINVRAYGAVGDGSTDDSAAFQAAMTNPAVYIPAGIYRIAARCFMTNGTVRGDGPNATIINHDFTGFCFDTLTRTNRATFTGIGFNGLGASDYSGGGSAAAKAALYWYSRGPIEIENCSFRNYTGYGIYASAVVSTTNTRDAIANFSRLYASNCWAGLYLEFSEYSRIDDSAFTECSYGIIAGAANQIIVGNRITDCTVGINVSQAISSTRGHNTITGNAINHCTYPVVARTATGLLINGNSIMGQGNVWFTNASGINFIGNLCEIDGFRFSGGGLNIVQHNTFYSGTTAAFNHNYGGSASFTRVVNNLAESGIAVPPSPTLTLAAGGAVTNFYDKIKLAGSGGAVTLTSTPTVLTNYIPDGTLVRIVGTSDSNTVELQDNGTLSGSLLELGATSRVLGNGDTVVLQWDSANAKWYEISFNNN